MVSCIFKKYLCAWVCVGLHGFVCVGAGPAEAEKGVDPRAGVTVGVSCNVGAGNPVLVF